MTIEQMGFGFDELAHAEAPAKPGRVRKSGPASSPSAAQPCDPAAAAALLEQHPDYRILRRLVPPTHFADAPTGPVARVLILDTETTGLDHSRDKLIELALVCVDVDRQTGQPTGAVDVYDGLQDPGMPIPKIAREITGITDEMVAGQQLDEARIAELLNGVDLVIAHNAGFDRPFVEARLPQAAGLDWACSFADIDWSAAGRSSAKLTSLAADLGLFYDAHRAEMDCHALLRVLMAEVPVSGAGSGESGLSRLLACAASPSYRLQATGAPFEAKDLLKNRAYRWDAAGRVWHLRLGNDEAMQAECEWLKQAVYGGRPARLQWERHDAKSRYSTRAGVAGWAQL